MRRDGVEQLDGERRVEIESAAQARQAGQRAFALGPGPLAGGEIRLARRAHPLHAQMRAEAVERQAEAAEAAPRAGPWVDETQVQPGRAFDVDGVHCAAPDS